MIGTGATAVQLVPELTKKVAELTVYQRTPIYVVPKIGLRHSSLAAVGVRSNTAGAPRVPVRHRHLFELGMVTAVLHYRGFRRLNIAAADFAKIGRFIVGARQGAARASSRPTTTSAASGPPGPTPTIARSPSRTCIWRPTASSGRAGRHRHHRRTQDRDRHPGAGHRFRPVGGQLPGHRGDRPRGAQPREVVARQRVSGIRGRVDPALPQLSEPGQPVRLFRTVLLQHHGVPDAPHGPALR